MPEYLGQCHALDDNVGKLIDCLKEKGIWDDTVIIYTSDHGTHFKTRNNEWKRSAHDNSSRIPLIIAGRGFEGGIVLDDCMASLIDLPATILDLAGIRKPEDWQGVSLQRVVSKEITAPKVAFMQISENHIGRAVRTKEWTYEARGMGDLLKDKDAPVYYDYLLYDNLHDPAQRKNLVDDKKYNNVLLCMRELLKEQMILAKERPFELKSDEEAPKAWQEWTPFEASCRLSVSHEPCEF